VSDRAASIRPSSDPDATDEEIRAKGDAVIQQVIRALTMNKPPSR
jgi:hypothetical protein